MSEATAMMEVEPVPTPIACLNAPPGRSCKVRRDFRNGDCRVCWLNRFDPRCGGRPTRKMQLAAANAYKPTVGKGVNATSGGH